MTISTRSTQAIPNLAELSLLGVLIGAVGRLISSVESFGFADTPRTGFHLVGVGPAGIEPATFGLKVRTAPC